MDSHFFSLEFAFGKDSILMNFINYRKISQVNDLQAFYFWGLQQILFQA